MSPSVFTWAWAVMVSGREKTSGREMKLIERDFSSLSNV